MKESTTDVTELAAITTKKTTKAAAGTMIVDSGATSHFVSNKINLPNMGKANEEVYLPDGSTLTTMTKTLLPFERMTMAA